MRVHRKDADGLEAGERMLHLAPHKQSAKAGHVEIPVLTCFPGGRTEHRDSVGETCRECGPLMLPLSPQRSIW